MRIKQKDSPNLIETVKWREFKRGSWTKFFKEKDGESTSDEADAEADAAADAQTEGGA